MIILAVSIQSVFGAESKTLQGLKNEQKKSLQRLDDNYIKRKTDKYRAYIAKLEKYKRSVMKEAKLNEANRTQKAINRAKRKMKELTASPVTVQPKQTTSNTAKEKLDKLNYFIPNFPDQFYSVIGWKGSKKYLFSPNGSFIVLTNKDQVEGTWKLKDKELQLSTGEVLTRKNNKFRLHIKNKNWKLKLLPSPFEDFYGVWQYRANNKFYQRTFFKNGSGRIQSGKQIFTTKKFKGFYKDGEFYVHFVGNHSIKDGILHAGGFRAKKIK